MPTYNGEPYPGFFQDNFFQKQMDKFIIRTPGQEEYKLTTSSLPHHSHGRIDDGVIVNSLNSNIGEPRNIVQELDDLKAEITALKEQIAELTVSSLDEYSSVRWSSQFISSVIKKHDEPIDEQESDFERAMKVIGRG